MLLNRNLNCAKQYHVPGLGMVLLLLWSLLPEAALAEQKMSREDYVAQSHEDLLAPCHNSAFVSCLDTSTQECTSRVNSLVEKCSRQLPKTITETNFDGVADDYASCVFGGLQQAFDKTSEQIGQCETQANLR